MKSKKKNKRSATKSKSSAKKKATSKKAASKKAAVRGDKPVKFAPEEAASSKDFVAKDSSNKKHSVVYFRLQEANKEYLTGKAEAAGVSLSEYMDQFVSHMRGL